VLKGIDLAIDEGEFVAIVGFSGSGKTTLISLLAGLTEPDRGQVLFKGQPVRGAGPERAVVFQNYSLMPWLSVAGNVSLAVDAVHPEWPAAKRADLVKRYVGMRWSAGRPNSPAACGSAWRWRARSPCSRNCCCWTSRCPRSMR
jgi:nitrate/nitrite transport system ATP-binding protein